MVILYIICLAPAFTVGILSQFIDLPEGMFVAMIICFIAITIVNPLVQSYSRIDVMRCIKCICQKMKIKISYYI